MSNFRSEDSPGDVRRSRDSSRASAGEDLGSPAPISKIDEPLAQLFVDRADEFIFWLYPDGRVVYANPAICHALGYSPEEFLSLRVWDISPRTEESWPARFADVKQRLSQTFVVEMHTRSAGIVPAQFTVKYAAIDDREYLLCCGYELREPKAQEHVPQIAEPFLLGSSIDAILVLHEGRVVDRNPQPFSGLREQIVQELETMLLESGSMRARIESAFRGENVTFDWRGHRPDGRGFHIECTLSRVEIEGNVRLLAVAVDVTGRRKSERTLAQLSGRLLQLQDEERRRIARDLHDSTGQNLGALNINLSMILSTATMLDPRARESLQESIALADACVREIRTLSYLLHPPLLDELGLASALRAYADGYSERTGILLDLDLPDVPRLPPAIEIALFRIVQEGLANIHRHAQSPTALIRLKHTQDLVELEVVDHGRGLPAGTLSHIGVGIAGMRERAVQLGGRLTIASGETGTTLHVVLPLHSQQLDAPV